MSHGKMSLNLIEKRKLRRFGLTIAFIIVTVFGGILPFIFSYHFPQWPFIIALVFFIPGMLFPFALNPIYIIWMKIVYGLGWVNLRIILSILFFGMFTPTSLIMKLFRRDKLLKQKVITKSTYRVLSKNQETTEMELPY